MLSLIILILTLSLVLLWSQYDRAPAGWQDRDGFHQCDPRRDAVSRITDVDTPILKKVDSQVGKQGGKNDL